MAGEKRHNGLSDSGLRLRGAKGGRRRLLFFGDLPSEGASRGRGQIRCPSFVERRAVLGTISGVKFVGAHAVYTG